jgi:hypothetical protein
LLLVVRVVVVVVGAGTPSSGAAVAVAEFDMLLWLIRTLRDLLLEQRLIRRDLNENLKSTDNVCKTSAKRGYVSSRQTIEFKVSKLCRS